MLRQDKGMLPVRLRTPRNCRHLRVHTEKWPSAALKSARRARRMGSVSTLTIRLLLTEMAP